MFRNTTLMVSACALVLATAAPANAEVTYLSAIGTNLVRCTDEGAPITYSMSGINDIYAMCRMPSNSEVLAVSTASFGATVYRVDNAWSGTPALTSVATLGRRYGTIAEVDDTLLGLADGYLYEIDLSDPGTPVETLIGNTGIDGTGGSGYDPATKTWYVGSTADDKLYTVDPLTAAATEIGSFGLDLGTQGMEWYDGQLHVMTQNNASGSVEIGTMDTTSGKYMYSFDLISGGGNIVSGALAIPEPASALLLVCGLLIAGRRR